MLASHAFVGCGCTVMVAGLTRLGRPRLWLPTATPQTAMLTAVLPESLVSAVVLHRHRAQRKRLLVLHANPTAPSDSVRGIASFLSPPG